MDPRDYLDPPCPFDSSAWQSPGPQTPPHALEHLDLTAVLVDYDACMARGDFSQGGTVLEQALTQARRLQDRYSELSLLSELMGYYRQAQQPELGLQAVEAGFALLGELGLGGTVTGATILINGATALSAFGQAKRALPCYEEAFRCYGKSLDPYDPRFAALMNNMAAAYLALGQQDQAIRCYRGALQILKHTDGTPDLAVTHINLAQALAASDPAGAQQELDTALDSLDALDLTWDGYYAYTCLKCAAAFRQFGLSEAARELEERAKLIDENT